MYEWLIKTWAHIVSSNPSHLPVDVLFFPAMWYEESILCMYLMCMYECGALHMWWWRVRRRNSAYVKLPFDGWPHTTSFALAVFDFSPLTIHQRITILPVDK